MFTGFASFSPNQDPSYSQFSPKSLIESPHISSAVQSPNNNTVAKPKKFFKSRNSVPDINLVNALSDPIASPSYYTNSSNPYQQQQIQSPFYDQVPVKTKKRKTKTTDESTKKSKTEKQPKQEKQPKAVKVEKIAKIEKPLKVEKVPKISKKKAKAIEKNAETPKPTRVLSRARKVVNYSEDKSRSPSPSSKAKASLSLANDSITSPNQIQESCNSNEVNVQNVSFDDQILNQSGASPSKHNAAGPPIVLRISKVRKIQFNFFFSIFCVILHSGFVIKKQKFKSLKQNVICM